LLNGIATVGRIQFDREHPILEKIFPLTDYRIQGLIAPVVSQPVFAIRTRPKKIYRLSDLAESGNTDQRRVDYVFSSITHRTRARHARLVSPRSRSGLLFLPPDSGIAYFP
jgi:Flp pilus assembly CpaF family ATPase